MLKHAAAWGIAVLSFAAAWLWNIPFPYIVVLGAAIGFVGNKFAPGAFAIDASPATIPSRAPLPFRATHAIRNTALAFALWMLVEGLLAWAFGWQGVLTQLGWFFTKAARVTFGGAYAVLPYVFQGRVDQHGWLTAAQMMDGLALGETTPGPLIMIVAFVGFVAA
jgi:chromate transporter